MRKQLTIIGSWTFSWQGQANCARLACYRPGSAEPRFRAFQVCPRTCRPLHRRLLERKTERMGRSAVVMIVNSDSIGLGLVSSLARPGGNVTGLSTMGWGMYGKRIEIFKQAIPQLSKVALLLSRENPTYRRGSPRASDIERDVRSLGVELSIVETEPETVEAAIASPAADGSRGMIRCGGRGTAQRDCRQRDQTSTADHFRVPAERGGPTCGSVRIDGLDPWLGPTKGGPVTVPTR